MHLAKALLIKVELQKMLDAKFIEAINYPKQVSNPIIVPKPDARIKICTNLWDVNKCLPKDAFRLPNIDTLVDNIISHEIFSLMDNFSIYNQIMIVKENKHKTTFTSPWGIYCYRVMSFGLKIVEETYQSIMTYISHDYMHDIVEDYVDDLIVKSKIHESHLEASCKIPY